MARSNMSQTHIADSIFTPQIIAIIGATCSGKSALALQLAPLLQSYIFSLDSLSIYKEIDIASAKPSHEELSKVKHFAINVLQPHECVHAGIFINLLNEALEICKQDSKNLIIVGGTSFYLKSILTGLSPNPKDFHKNNPHNQQDSNNTHKSLESPKQYTYELLYEIDKDYATKISPNDSYRIQKGIEIFIQTGLSPSEFFTNNPPTPFHKPIHIFNLNMPRELLRDNIDERTHAMIESGIIDEAKSLLQHYGKDIQPFKSIGLKECLLFLNGEINKNILESLIATHTKQLAKRQMTFNRTQFTCITQLDYTLSIQEILNIIKNIQ
ncbi:tRNA (adenosine(37)-N6)-dimethylallyltransferase MiaA [Helicobacter didelphidarum]|uniref:tRNA (adenosine(37)-N6)-dimethylallyltransferase MiaA n=1 Tax=Helicobacter didelphidarum TaxID=2040648 RepID=UPI001FE7E082|nr:tRNA (adenosine(37)-N6)-dimethylallyltransferase MiaA [Helicobacter didelphidarum]